MKKYILLLAVAINCGNSLQSQSASRFSLGAGLGMLVDMRVESRNSSPDAWPNQDMATHFAKPYEKTNLGYHFNVGYMATPLLNVHAGVNMAKISGSNANMYYLNSFKQVDLGISYIMGNHNIGKRKLQFSPTIGMTLTEFKSTLYFKEDKSEQNVIQRRPWGGYVGANLTYRISPRVDLVLNSTVNMVFDGGFDGWDYGSAGFAADEYWRNNLGVQILLGKTDKHLYHRSATSGIASIEPATPPVNVVSKGGNDSAVAAMMAEIKQLKLGINTTDEMISKLLDKMKSVEMEKMRLKGGDSIVYSPGELYKQLIADLLTATVFFDKGQAVLDDEDFYELFRWKRKVSDLVNNAKYYVVITANTDATGSDETNASLRLKRADAVKRWILLNTGVPSYRIRVQEMNPSVKAENNELLNRRTLVEIEFE